VLLSRPVSSFRSWREGIRAVIPLLLIAAVVALGAQVAGKLIVDDSFKPAFLLFEIFCLSFPALLFSASLVLFSRRCSTTGAGPPRSISPGARFVPVAGARWWYLTDPCGRVLPVFYSDLIGFGRFSIFSSRGGSSWFSRFSSLRDRTRYGRSRGRRAELLRYRLPIYVSRCSFSLLSAISVSEPTFPGRGRERPGAA